MFDLEENRRAVAEIMARGAGRQAAAKRALDAVRADFDAAIMDLLDDGPSYWTPAQIRRNGCFTPPEPFSDLYERTQTGRIRSALERLRHTCRVVRVEGVGDTRRGAVQYRSTKWETPKETDECLSPKTSAKRSG